MNRLTKAWKALRGTLEPEVRERVQVVYKPAPDTWLNVFSVRVGGGIYYPRYEHFATCELAHAAHVGKEVKCNLAASIGGKTFLLTGLEPIEVQPKPKRPKGNAT